MLAEREAREPVPRDPAKVPLNSWVPDISLAAKFRDDNTQY
jgi:hypothetical protein